MITMMIMIVTVIGMMIIQARNAWGASPARRLLPPPTATGPARRHTTPAPESHPSPPSLPPPALLPAPSLLPSPSPSLPRSLAPSLATSPPPSLRLLDHGSDFRVTAGGEGAGWRGGTGRCGGARGSGSSRRGGRCAGRAALPREACTPAAPSPARAPPPPQAVDTHTHGTPAPAMPRSLRCAR